MEKKLVSGITILIVICVFCAGCRLWWDSYDEIRSTTVEFVQEHEAELLALYDKFERAHQLDANDYSSRSTEKKFGDSQTVKIYYYHHKEKMEIWFDQNHDGKDWGIVYSADPNFNMNNKSVEETYEEIGNGFYTYIWRFGF